VGVVLFFVGYLLREFLGRRKVTSAENKAQKVIEEAERQAETKRKEASIEVKEELYRLRTGFEKESEDKRRELAGREAKLSQKEENLDRKADLWEKKERDIAEKSRVIESRERELGEKKQELARLLEEEKNSLERISGLSSEEAKNLLLERIEKEIREEKALLARKIEDEVKETAEKKAKEIISSAIQRYATEQVTESTVSVVSLPSDEMKGRIIGREGRNIRAFEAATGINVVIDDTPEAVTLSGFDPVRREIARLSLEKLIADGRIHPGRIEEVAGKVKEEIEASIKEEGEKISFEIGVYDLHKEEKNLLGRLKYRTSYGQNVLQHSLEVAHLMGIMAAELRLNPKLAKRIGILHDIGKAVDHQVEGSHDQIGARLAEKFKETEEIFQAIRSHHETEPPATVYGVLLQAADALSAARPGARRETLESYVKRLEDLENIAHSFPGVEKAHAIQAGREIRVMVQPDKVNDGQIVVLAHDLSEKLQKETEYAGQIKVTVIREKRAVDYAK